ncbi:MAG: hypothetical protein ACE5FS_14725 [Paracoccaceae bacterium]
MTSPYTSQSISGYNSSPPSDDGSATEANRGKWATIKSKIGDPLKTLAEAIDSAVVTFAGKTINTDADEANAVAGSVSFTSSELTISSGAVTATRTFHTIDTESDAATDDLDTITATGLGAGTIIYLLAANSARIATVKDGTGNINLRGDSDVELDAENLTCLRWDGSAWYEVFRPSTGGWDLIESQTASASATLDFTTGIDGTYDAYALVLTNVLPATDGAALWLRVQESAAWQADAADYAYRYETRIVNASTYNASNSTGDAKIVLAGAAVGGAAGEGASGKIEFYGPATTAYHGFTWNIIEQDTTPITRNLVGGGAYIGATGAVTGVRVMFSTGNIASGTIALYGLRK